MSVNCSTLKTLMSLFWKCVWYRLWTFCNRKGDYIFSRDHTNYGSYCALTFVKTTPTFVWLSATNVCIPTGTLSPKSCTRGTSSCWCRRSFSPTALCGPFMYWYCSTFTTSCSPFLTPGEHRHCIKHNVFFFAQCNWLNRAILSHGQLLKLERKDAFSRSPGVTCFLTCAAMIIVENR